LTRVRSSSLSKAELLEKIAFISKDRIAASDTEHLAIDDAAYLGTSLTEGADPELLAVQAAARGPPAQGTIPAECRSQSREIAYLENDPRNLTIHVPSVSSRTSRTSTVSYVQLPKHVDR
jgi:hypothetical protein